MPTRAWMRPRASDANTTSRNTAPIPPSAFLLRNGNFGYPPADGLSASTGIPPSRQGNAGQGEPRLPRRLNTHAPPRPKQRLASRHDSAAQRQPVLDGPPRLPRLHTAEMTNGPIGFAVRERSARRSRFFLGKTHKRSSGTQRVGTRCFRQENRSAVPSLKNKNHPYRRLFRQG